MTERHHKPAYIALYVVTVLVFLVAITINALGSRTDIGIFLNTTGALSDKYYLEITPAGWTFAIWGFIYTYQAIFLIYGLSTIVRKSEGGYLYYRPGFMPPMIYVAYILNLCCNIAWMILFGRELIPYALVALALIAFFLYVSLFFSMHSLHKYAPDLINQEKASEIRLVIGIVHNGLAMYATWTSIATLLNTAMVLIYYLGFSQEIGCTIALCILAGEVVVYIILDFVLFEEHFRYLFTPYIVLHVALAGSVSKNWNPAKPNSILTIGLIGIGTLMVFVKVAHCIYMSWKKPLYKKPSEESNKTSSF